MSIPFNAETEINAQITRLQLESDDLARRAAHASREADRDLLHRQADELAHEIVLLRQRLAHGTT